MINLDFNASTFLGVCLVGSSIGLYTIRKVSPELSRDSDVILSTVGIAAGSILTFQGWRLDPILLFCQTCSIGIALFFVLESIRLRHSSYYFKKNQINELNIQKNNSILCQGWRLPSKPKDRKKTKKNYMFIQIQKKLLQTTSSPYNQ